MHIVRNKSKQGKKIYGSTLLRESYRDENGKVKKRTIANLSNCSDDEILALEFAFKNKHRIHELQQAGTVRLTQGQSIGSLYTVYQVVKKLGIENALGDSHQSKLAIWQIIAKVIEQGSCLSAARIANIYPVSDVLGLEKSFNEDDLYYNLTWLAKNQNTIEKKLFKFRKKNISNLFLYDVTSSYLEGECNELAAYGYNRDKKSGKKQIVAGLLCDDEGIPVSIEMFKGNTNDTKTFHSQIEKVKKEFGCKNQKVIFVGDRGMIKSGQIDELKDEEFHYITAITEAQIRKLIKEDILQLSLFTKDLTEVEYNGERYVLRCNLYRAREIKESRESKKRSIELLIQKKNEYLQEHAKATIEAAEKEINKKISNLKVKQWLSIKTNNRNIELIEDKEVLAREEELDGCYCIKTDVQEVPKETINSRYKDLGKVENAFRTSKQTFLEMQPWYVRTEESTRGRALIIMLAYMVIQELRKKWNNIELTVEEGLRSLSTLSTMEMEIEGKSPCYSIPAPNELNEELLKVLDIKLPEFLVKSGIKVDTRKKLVKERKHA